MIPRIDVEVAALRLFEKTALDVQATRRLVAKQLASKAADAQTLIEHAERDVATRQAALARSTGTTPQATRAQPATND